MHIKAEEKCIEFLLKYIEKEVSPIHAWNNKNSCGGARRK